MSPSLFLQDIGADRGGIAVPVHVLLPFQLVEDEGELVEEGGVPSLQASFNAGIH